jgi:hypothetical protein
MDTQSNVVSYSKTIVPKSSLAEGFHDRRTEVTTNDGGVTKSQTLTDAFKVAHFRDDSPRSRKTNRVVHSKKGKFDSLVPNESYAEVLSDIPQKRGKLNMTATPAGKNSQPFFN